MDQNTPERPYGATRQALTTDTKTTSGLKLFTTFFRIGAFTLGGGYAMIPIIQAEVVEKNKWIRQ